MICILVFACVLFRQGETSQGTSEEKKMGMIFNGQLAWVEPKRWDQSKLLEFNLVKLYSHS